MSSDADSEMVLADTRRDFIELCEVRLDQIYQVLNILHGNEGDRDQHLLDVKKNFLLIKGLCGGLGLSAIAAIAHSADDYMETSADFGPNQYHDIRLFADKIHRLMETGDNPGDDDVAEIIHGLPYKGRGTITKGLKRDLRMLFLMEKGIQRKVIGRELSSFGFNVILANTVIEAIDLAITHRPDIIVSSMYADRLTGIELANIFHDIEATFHANFLLIAPSGTSQAKLALLPKGATVLYKGSSFSRDLFKFLRDHHFLK